MRDRRGLRGHDRAVDQLLILNAPQPRGHDRRAQLIERAIHSKQRTVPITKIKIKRGDDIIAENTATLYRSRDNHGIELAPTVALFEARATRDTSRQLKVEVSTGKKGWQQEASWDFHVVYKG